MTGINKNSSRYLLNPVHYLGGITFLFFLVQILTGVFLVMNFIPYITEAYQSLYYIMNQLPYGFIIRTLHRYSAFGMLILCILHMIRMFVTGRYLKPRDVGWVSGIILLFFTIVIIITGFISSYDVFAQAILNNMAEVFNVGRRDFQMLLSVVYGFHLLFPILVFVFLITHFSRIARPKIFPSMPLTFIILGILVVVSGLFPISSLVENPDIPSQGFSIISILLNLGIVSALLLLLAFLPYFSRKKRIYAYVDENRCTGCMYCAEVCPKKAIEEKHITKNKQLITVATVLNHKCQGCGICVGACRSSVIQLEDHKDEILLEEVRKAWIEQTL